MVYKKFKKVKLNIIKGRKLLPFPTARIIQDHEDRLAALEKGATSDDDDSEPSNTDAPQEQAPVTDTLSITVDDGTDPIEGASVVIGSTTQTTDSTGKAEFAEMEYDDYSAEISADGYTTKTETIAFRSNHKSFTVSLVLSG